MKHVSASSAHRLLTPKFRPPAPQPHSLPRRTAFSRFLFHDGTGPTAPPFLPAPLHPTPSALSKNTLWGCPSSLGGSSGGRRPPPYGRRPGTSACPVSGALGLGVGVARLWGRGHGAAQPVLDTGRGQAEGLPHPAIGCRGRLEGAGKESGPKGLSYPKNAALGEPSQGWTRVDAPFWRQEVGKVAKRGARRAADLGGGVRSEGVPLSLQRPSPRKPCHTVGLPAVGSSPLSTPPVLWRELASGKHCSLLGSHPRSHPSGSPTSSQERDPLLGPAWNTPD